ncbi:MAG: hypothetical protein AAF196_02225 [Planctomycetota bacterium]
MSDSTQRISIDPATPVAGQSLKICYDFDGSGINKTELCITTKPPEQMISRTVSTADNCTTITVPETALTILIEDKDGDSPDFSRPVIQSNQPAPTA